MEVYKYAGFPLCIDEPADYPDRLGFSCRDYMKICLGSVCHPAKDAAAALLVVTYSQCLPSRAHSFENVTTVSTAVYRQACGKPMIATGYSVCLLTIGCDRGDKGGSPWYLTDPGFTTPYRRGKTDGIAHATSGTGMIMHALCLRSI